MEFLSFLLKNKLQNKIELMFLRLSKSRKNTAISQKKLLISYKIMQNNLIFNIFLKYLNNNNVECIVIGLPLRLNNEATDVTSHVYSFKNKINQLS